MIAFIALIGSVIGLVTIALWQYERADELEQRCIDLATTLAVRGAQVSELVELRSEQGALIESLSTEVMQRGAHINGLIEHIAMLKRLDESGDVQRCVYGGLVARRDLLRWN